MLTVSAESGTQHRKVSTTTFNLFGSWLHLNDRPLAGNSATCTGLPKLGFETALFTLQRQCGTYRCHII
jgi:hypothetical protein